MDAAEKALQEDLKRKREKGNRFGDEFGRVGRRRKGQGKSFEEEVDRFDEDDDEEDAKPRAKRERNDLHSSLKKGRDLKAVEGAAEDWEHSEDSEEEDERRKYEEESGFRVEPFNTDMEREEGHFDSASGHYVEDKFKMSQRDAWLDEVQDKYAHGVLKQPKFATKKVEDEMEEEVDVQELLKFLTKHLKDEENVVAMMRRLKKDKESFDADVFNQITEASDKVMASGYHNVMIDPKEKLQAKITSEEPANGTAEVDDGRYWEYKLELDQAAIPSNPPDKMSLKELKTFLDAQGVSYKGLIEKEELEAKAKQTINRIHNQVNEVFGPFTTGQMRSWNAAGYFSGERVTFIRQTTEDGSGDFVRSDRADLEAMFA
eukprot:CAMPEP_0184302474 /NCGR_PEP_ID=MMETSP1049-20130417/12441_1 /TAXON_ID=77928 /ORGANISM="Proteomonas sulcata, Strain CCMP704" /LENGTH=373 /DNA_ID=CAMNT_0026613777 /DNA_START=1 /DNA_END=1122 /DNA_ORIENTATION=+